MWTAKCTGDMTLSILDENDFKILGVDMLGANTLRAGDGGEQLARTLNDLALLSQAADDADQGDLQLVDDSASHSPTPWQTDFQEEKRRIRVIDANHRVIGERVFPQRTNQATITQIVQRMQHAVHHINATVF